MEHRQRKGGCLPGARLSLAQNVSPLQQSRNRTILDRRRCLKIQVLDCPQESFVQLENLKSLAHLSTYIPSRKEAPPWGAEPRMNHDVLSRNRLHVSVYHIPTDSPEAGQGTPLTPPPAATPCRLRAAGLAARPARKLTGLVALRCAGPAGRPARPETGREAFIWPAAPSSARAPSRDVVYGRPAQARCTKPASPRLQPRPGASDATGPPHKTIPLCPKRHRLAWRHIRRGLVPDRLEFEHVKRPDQRALTLRIDLHGFIVAPQDHTQGQRPKPVVAEDLNRGAIHQNLQAQ